MAGELSWKGRKTYMLELKISLLSLSDCLANISHQSKSGWSWKTCTISSVLTCKKRSSIKMIKMDHCEVAHKTAVSVAC